MPSVITVENIGKSYMISRSGGRGDRYLALRDIMVERAKRLIGRGSGDSSKEEFWALKDVSFEIEQGERVGIIGRNGAGKSTLLKVLSRITDPTTGRITLHGRVASLLEVGTGFHPELTGRENIYLNGAILGMSKKEIERKFDEIVAFAEVEKFLDTPVKRYSSGMYVRLAFAVAAHLEPEILIVDEVLAVGDAQFQKKCLGKMQDVGKSGRTVLFVSHDMRAVKSLCTSAMVMDHGRASAMMPVDRAVEAYTAQSQTSEIEFPVETDEIIVHDYRILQDGLAVSEYDSGLPIEVDVDFEVLKDLTVFRLGIYCRTASGDTLFRSLMADWNSDLENIRRGRYRASVNIPANILAPGGYIFNLTSSRFGIRDYLYYFNIDIPVNIRPPAGFNQAHMSEPIVGQVLIGEPWRVEANASKQQMPVGLLAARAGQ